MAHFETAVGGDLGGDGAAPVGAEVDDHARTAVDHRGGEVANHVGDAQDVDPDDLLKLVGGHVPEGGVGVDERRC